jgi:hypothetical protein
LLHLEPLCILNQLLRHLGVVLDREVLQVLVEVVAALRRPETH